MKNKPGQICVIPTEYNSNLKTNNFSKMLRTKYVNEPLLLLPPRTCLSIQCIDTFSVDIPDGIEIINYICYILLPVILVLSLFGQTVNLIVLTKQIRLSTDTYFYVLSTTAFIHVATSIIVSLPHYIDRVLTEVIYYSVLCHEWTHYIIVWIILSVAIERTLTVALYQTYNQVSPTQSWVISCLVIGVGCISTVPRLWQYDITNYSNQTTISDQEQQDNLYTDQIVIMKTGNHEDYDIVYFWYLTCIFTGLPFLLMLLTVVGLSTSVKTSRTVQTKYRTETALILNRRLKEEIRLTYLIIRLMILYFVLMFPLVLINSLYFLGILDMEDHVCITVTNVLSLWYHVYFVVQQPLYFCYNKQYRLTFIGLCCCLC